MALHGGFEVVGLIGRVLFLVESLVVSFAGVAGGDGIYLNGFGAQLRAKRGFASLFLLIVILGLVLAISFGHGSLELAVIEILRQGQSPACVLQGQVQLGSFWAGKPYTRKQTILKVDGKEYRTGSTQGMTAEECEAILGLFLKGEYDHEQAVNGKLLNQVDWTKPSRFSKRGDSISIGFLHKGGDGSGFFDLQIKQEGKKLIITQMFQAIP